MFRSPHGIVCENGHGAPSLVDAEGRTVDYDPGPDAVAARDAALNPWNRVRQLEARVVMLASNNSQLRAALRGMVTHTHQVSDRGTAKWYQAGLRALNMEVGGDGG